MQQGDRQMALGIIDANNGFFEGLEGQVTVGQGGHAVVVGEKADTLLGLLALGDIAAENHHPVATQVALHTLGF